jgi:hypothetical protein
MMPEHDLRVCVNAIFEEIEQRECAENVINDTFIYLYIENNDYCKMYGFNKMIAAMAQNGVPKNWLILIRHYYHLVNNNLGDDFVNTI